MGKHRHAKDKQYILQSEYKTDWGGQDGKRKRNDRAPIAQLPFNCCALGLQPFSNPVCTKDGNVFDLINIIPFIKKYKQCPVTGNSLKISDLIKLNFAKNDKGEYHDPISFKTFTDNTVIVAIKTSGNVFAGDTVEQLNKKAKFWKDLLTSESFTHQDIIVLNDPKELQKKTVMSFSHVRNNIKFDLVKKPEKVSDFINQNSTAKRVMQEVNEREKIEEQKKQEKEEQERKELQEIIKKQNSKEQSSVQDFINYAMKVKLYRHSRETTKFQSVSVTTTASNVSSGQTEFRELTESEIRKKIYDDVKGRANKGYITLKTNLGDLNFRIHCDLVPITGENFLELAEKKYYKNQKFHRLVRDFMLQGGDPTGTGRGGQSIFGGKFQDEFHPKLTHSDPGLLSMANSGPDTNGSQFFITLSDCPHLDNKHTIFGEVMGGIQTLYKINKIETSKERPLEDIIIEDIIIHTNPYREAIQRLKEEEKKKNKKENTELQQHKKSERWIEDIKGFEPSKKIKLDEDEEEEEKKKKKPVKKAGILDSILSAPVQTQKFKRTNFNFNNW